MAICPYIKYMVASNGVSMYINILESMNTMLSPCLILQMQKSPVTFTNVFGKDYRAAKLTRCELSSFKISVLNNIALSLLLMWSEYKLKALNLYAFLNFFCASHFNKRTLRCFICVNSQCLRWTHIWVPVL